MGYYTRHSLSVISGDDDELTAEEHRDLIAEKSGYDKDWLFDGDRAKWYSHQRDMKEYSLKFPNTLFILEGEGEENDDIWIEYHKDGKMQLCKTKITFDEFDETKLK